MIKPDYELATWMFAARHSLLEDGFDADAIMLKAGLDLSELHSSTQQIPKRVVARVWQTIADTTHNDAYCLRTLAHLSDPIINALVTSIKACGSIQNALQILFKYSQVAHPGMGFSLSADSSLKLTMVKKDPNALITHCDLDVAFGLFAKITRDLLPSEHKPLRISLSRPEPHNKAGYLVHFECPVEFGTDVSTIEFPLDVLNGTIPGHDPVLAKQLEQYLADLAESDEMAFTNKPIDEQVAIILERVLHRGTPKISGVAEELGMSARSLQRKLKEAELSFSEVLSETRLTLAKSKLSKGGVESLEALANDMGFTETSNFVRFFKQHTGQTPSTYVRCVTPE